MGWVQMGFQVGALQMGENGLIYLAIGLGLMENWVGWVGIGLFFCGFEWVEHMC